MKANEARSTCVLTAEAEARTVPNGVWVTMLTPFGENGQVDYKALEAMIEWYIGKGVDGLFAVCQSSEMFYLSPEESAQVAQFVVEHVHGRIPVVASGHICDDVEKAIEQLRPVIGCGVEAPVLVTNRLAAQDEDDEVFKRNADQILEAFPDRQFGLYECPYPYKRLLSDSLVEWCKDTGRFIFLKDTSCSLDYMRSRIDILRGSSFKLFNANSTTLLESLRMGADGFCGVMANFHPEIYVWLTHHWQEDPQKAEIIQEFAAVSSLIELQQYPKNAKYHMSLCGLPVLPNVRCANDKKWTALQEIETRQLWRLSQSLKSLLNLESV